MALTRSGLRYRTALALAVAVAVSSLTGCGGPHPTADKCSRQAKPATHGQTVTWNGVRFTIPVGWYAVRVCFGTGSTTPPVGYLTSQPPQAQCAPADAAGGSCHPPITDLNDHDAMVEADETSTSLIRTIRPNTTVARRPAQIITRRTSRQYGAGQVVETYIRLPLHRVLRLTAYLGSSATSQHHRFLAMVNGATRRPSE